MKSHGVTRHMPQPFSVAVIVKLDAKHVNIEKIKIVAGGITPNASEARDAEGIMGGQPYRQ